MSSTPVEAGTKRWTVVQLIPRLSPGGAERSTMETARALVAGGHRSIVISGGGRWVSRLKAEGSEHILLPIDRKKLSALWVALRLRWAMQHLRPDLVHVRSRLPAWLLRLAMVGSRTRFAQVNTVHGLNSVSNYSRILTRANRVVAVSRTTRDYLLQSYPGLDASRLRIVPPGADPLEFPPGYACAQEWLEALHFEFPMLSGGLLLTLPGRGTRLKGHGDALRLLARVRAAGVDARLLLLGVVEEQRRAYVRELQALAVELGIADVVAFSGPRGDVRDVYAASDLVLQLSVRPESFGRVVAEALCLGRPVIGYAHGGVGDLLDQLYPAGRVPLRDLDALTERTLALLADAPRVDTAQVPKVSDSQALTLSVYSELIEGTAPDPAALAASA